MGECPLVRSHLELSLSEVGQSSSILERIMAIDPEGITRREFLLASGSVLAAASCPAGAADAAVPADAIAVEIEINGAVRRRPRSARHPARHAARASRLAWHQERLRSRSVRRMHRAHRWTPRSVLPDAGGPGARQEGHHDRRRDRAEWRACIRCNRPFSITTACSAAIARRVRSCPR